MIIEDAPKYAWRGMMIDVARQFYTIEELMDLLDHFAMLKINKLHLHLSDDEAWRVQSDNYPELCDIASFRGYGLKINPQFGSSSSKYGGYYTKNDIKKLIEYAKNLYIEIMPEFDFPAHSYALIQALPKLEEKEDKSVYKSVQEYRNNILNPALSFTWEFLENILKEMSELFESDYIHLGFDERAKGSWEKSPSCQKMMLEQNIKNTDELQNYFSNRLFNILKKYNKKPAYWEEAIYAKLDKNSLLFAWQNEEITLKMAQKGYSIIASPAQYCYFDVRENTKFTTEGLYWVDVLTLEKTYSFTPAKHSNIKGVQGALWGETLHNKNNVYKMLFPRIFALAEVAWSHTNRKNLEQFKKNLELHIKEISQFKKR